MILCAAALARCGDKDPLNVPRASSSFLTDAPFCGPMLVEGRIGGTLLFRDTLKHGVPSSPIEVIPGTHVIAARSVLKNGDTYTAIYNWTDTTVALGPLQSLTRKLDLYCS